MATATSLCSFQARPFNPFQQKTQQLFTSIIEENDDGQDSDSSTSSSSSSSSSSDLSGSFVATPLVVPNLLMSFDESMCPSIRPDELFALPVTTHDPLQPTDIQQIDFIDFGLDLAGFDFNLDLLTESLIPQDLIPHDQTTGGQCAHCQQTFGNDAALKAHTNANKRLGRAVQCADCSSEFWFTCQLRQHAKQCASKPRAQRKHKTNRASNNVCDVCDRSFSSEHALREHAIRHTPSDLPFACSVCSKGFVRKKKMEIHVATVHHGQKSYTCSHCPRRFSQKGARNLHVKDVHQKLRQFQCPGCTKAFSRKSNWKRHCKTQGH